MMAEIDEKTEYEWTVLSIAWEAESGYDSIPTVKNNYPQTGSGAYRCVWPHCNLVKENAIEMWVHVHTKHGEDTRPPALRT